MVSQHNKPDIRWIKQGKEFSYHGEMFDVVKTIDKNQKSFIYCINDKKESRLITNYNKNHNRHKTTGKNVNKILNYHLFFQKIFSLHTVSSSHFCYGLQSFRVLTLSLSIPSPPPKEA